MFADVSLLLGEGEDGLLALLLLPLVLVAGFAVRPALNGLCIPVAVGLRVVFHTLNFCEGSLVSSLLDGDDTFAVGLVANMTAKDGFVVNHLRVLSERLKSMLDEGRADFCCDLLGVLKVGFDFNDFDQVPAGAVESLDMTDFNLHGLDSFLPRSICAEV